MKKCFGDKVLNKTLGGILKFIDYAIVKENNGTTMEC